MPEEIFTANPYDSPQQVKPGMSGTGKVLLGIGIGCGVLLLLCCGGFGILGFMGSRWMRNAITEDPARIRQITGEIAAIEVPETLAPKMGMDGQIPFTGMTWQMALYQDEHAADDEPATNMLMLGQLSGGPADDEQFRTQFNQSLSQQSEFEDVRIVESETLRPEINGEQARFELAKAVGKGTENEYWQVEGQFRGKSGPAMLMLRLKTPPHTKEDAMRVVESLGQ